jgi:hypothetical protein
VTPDLAFYESVVGNIDGFLFQCLGPGGGYRFLEVTPIGFKRITGHDASEFVGRSERSFADLLWNDHGAELQAQTETIEADKRWSFHYPIRTKGGGKRLILESGWSEFDAALGQIVLKGLVLDARDLGAAEADEAAFKSRIEAIMGYTQAIERLLDHLRLLSLNARIEAARAGGEGSGFAQVSSEMKLLANRASGLVSGISGQGATIKYARSGDQSSSGVMMI